MYRDHVPSINATCRRDAQAFKRAVLFAVLSARTQFVTVPKQLKDVQLNGAKSKHLFSWKRTTYHWLEQNVSQWHARLCAESDATAALRIAVECPGLSLVKGAFVLQFLGFDVACIDSRNADREGIARDHWQLNGATHGKKFEAKLAEYVAYVRGRSEELWNEWCREIGRVYKLDPETVSAIHHQEICQA